MAKKKAVMKEFLYKAEDDVLGAMAKMLTKQTKRTAIEDHTDFIKSGKKPDEHWEEWQKLVERLIEENKPKPDDPNCKSPCGSCIGAQYGCTVMHKRNPKKECATYVKVGTLKITYK